MPQGGIVFRNFLQFLVSQPQEATIIVVAALCGLFVTSFVGYTWWRKRHAHHPYVTTPVAPPVIRNTTHEALEDAMAGYIMMTGVILRREPHDVKVGTIVERLLRLAENDKRHRLNFVSEAIRYAGQHHIGSSAFMQCPREVLTEAVRANLGALHQWGAEGNNVIEYALGVQEGAKYFGAEPSDGAALLR